jgi:hypothetical protein
MGLKKMGGGGPGSCPVARVLVFVVLKQPLVSFDIGKLLGV